MQIKVTEKCDRCQRVAELEIDSQDLGKFEQTDERRTTAFNAVQEFLKGQTQEDMPDLIVWFKGTVFMKGRICDAFCKETIQNQLDKGIFRAMDATKRKERKPKTEGEEGTATGDSETPKKRGKGKKAAT
jgi:hypothetical protein